MKSKARILVVDDETSMREMVSILLKRNDYDVDTAASGLEVRELFEKGERFDLVVTDLLMDRGGGLEVLNSVKTMDSSCEVIVVTAFATPETAVEAMKNGAIDYVTKPFNVEEFLIIVRKALERRRLIRQNVDLRARVRGKYRFADIAGRSEAMQEVIDICRKVAGSPTTVLISGESGTGKEVVARAIHFASDRAEKPFIAVNCGALPEHLMESELFGHTKGAFTGATEDNEGLVRAGEGGTVFLDEIGELPLPLQVKLLRVLQDRMVRPVGASSEVDVDIRILAATNRDLKDQVEKGEFRKDLFYRINVIHIVIPPLRERREDIVPLIDQLLERFSVERDVPASFVKQDAMRLLIDYDYPGNVRELANILERAAILASSQRIEISDLPPELAVPLNREQLRVPDVTEDGIDLELSLADFERYLIEKALEQTGGVRTKAASLLGISFRSLRYRLSKLGFVDDDKA
jgi:two-component system, NtrC family, response regulator PilR